MKKICLALITVGVLWFTFCSAMDYAGALIRNLHLPLSELCIIAPERVDGDELVDQVQKAAQAAGTPILCEYTSTTSPIQTAYSVFLDDPAGQALRMPGAFSPFGEPRPDEPLSNSRSAGNRFDYVDFIHSIRIYPFALLAELHPTDMASTFFVQSEKVSAFTAALGDGYQVICATDSVAGQRQTLRWDSFQIWCLGMMAILTLFHFFYHSKAVTIKRLHGFSIPEVVVSELSALPLVPIVLTPAALLVSAAALQLRSGCGADYIRYSWKGCLALEALMLAAMALPGLACVLEGSASDLKRIRFPKTTTLIAWGLQITLCVLMLFPCRALQTDLEALSKVKRAEETAGFLDPDAVYVTSFNASARSIALENEEVARRSVQLYNSLKDDCVFVDASGYSDTRSWQPQNVYVNEAYLCLVGIQLRKELQAENEIVVLIPERWNSPALQEAYLTQLGRAADRNSAVSVQTYRGGALPSFAVSDGTKHGGWVEDPVLILVVPEALPAGDAMIGAAFSSGNILIFSETPDPVWAAIRSAGMKAYISNIRTLREAFADEQLIVRMELIQSLLQAFVYTLMFCVACVFRTSVYFSAKGKYAAVCRMSGLARWEIHWKTLALRLMAYLLLLAYLGWGTAGWCLTAALLFDLLQFTLADAAFTKKRIYEELKGGIVR